MTNVMKMAVLAALAVAITGGDRSLLCAQSNAPAIAPVMGTLIADGVLYQPTSVAVGKDGNIYVADAGNYVVRKLDLAGNLTVVAGTPGSTAKRPITSQQSSSGTLADCATDDGNHCLATKAVFSGPRNITLDTSGNLFVSDYSASKIRRVDASTGIITVYAGQLLGGWSNTQLRNPEGIAFDSQGNLYVADRNNNAIRKVIPPVPPAMRGTLTTVAGLGPDSPGCSGDGGPAAAATLNEPQDVAVDASGNIYIADAACRRIRMIGSDGKISTVVGTGAGSGPEGPHPPFNGPADALQVNLGVPVGVKADSAGNLYISDSAFEVVWFYDQNSKTVSVIAGLAPGTKLCPDGSNGYGDGCVGPKAPLNVPYRVALDGNGNLYIPEQGGTSAPMPPFAVRVLSGISH